MNTDRTEMTDETTNPETGRMSFMTRVRSASFRSSRSRSSSRSRDGRPAYRFLLTIQRLSGFPPNWTTMDLQHPGGASPTKLELNNGVAHVHQNFTFERSFRRSGDRQADAKFRLVFENGDKFGKTHLDLEKLRQEIDIEDNVIGKLVTFSDNKNLGGVVMEYKLGYFAIDTQTSESTLPPRTEPVNYDEVALTTPVGPLGASFANTLIPPTIIRLVPLPDGSESPLQDKIISGSELIKFNGADTTMWTLDDFKDMLVSRKDDLERHMVFRVPRTSENEDVIAGPGPTAAVTEVEEGKPTDEKQEVEDTDTKPEVEDQTQDLEDTNKKQEVVVGTDGAIPAVNGGEDAAVNDDEDNGGDDTGNVESEKQLTEDGDYITPVITAKKLSFSSLPSIPNDSEFSSKEDAANGVEGAEGNSAAGSSGGDGETKPSVPVVSAPPQDTEDEVRQIPASPKSKPEETVKTEVTEQPDSKSDKGGLNPGERPSPKFEVTIPRFVIDAKQQYVMYDIAVQGLAQDNNSKSRVLRRYNNFADLKAQLEVELDGATLPSLPSKWTWNAIFNRFDEELVEDRRMALEMWLKTICDVLSHTLQNCSTLQDFLTVAPTVKEVLDFTSKNTVEVNVKPNGQVRLYGDGFDEYTPRPGRDTGLDHAGMMVQVPSI